MGEAVPHLGTYEAGLLEDPVFGWVERMRLAYRIYDGIDEDYRPCQYSEASRRWAYWVLGKAYRTEPERRRHG